MAHGKRPASDGGATDEISIGEADERYLVESFVA